MIHDTSVAAISFLISFLAVLAAGPSVIAKMHALKYGQTVNSDVPLHKAKQGTPTMGGVLFLLGVVVALLVVVSISSAVREADLRDLVAIVLVFTLHLLIGYADDYLSIKRGKNLGLKARQKLAAQGAVAFGFAFYIYYNDPGARAIDMAITPGHIVSIPALVYCILAALLIVAMSNFTNLADGLDGLASGLSLIVVTGLAAYASFQHPGVAIFGWALGGAILAFLVYNGNPARIFMGDTGSLALGSSMTAMALLARSEIVFLVFMIVFIAEGVSVILQVASFKTTGKRIFKMAPLHHHFEQLGWKESQIVLRFWIAGLIALWLGMMLEQRFVQ